MPPAPAASIATSTKRWPVPAETADQLELRQANAAIELARQEDYDHVVVNETGEVERTAARIEEIIADEHRRHPGRRVRI